MPGLKESKLEKEKNRKKREKNSSEFCAIYVIPPIFIRDKNCSEFCAIYVIPPIFIAHSNILYSAIKKRKGGFFMPPSLAYAAYVMLKSSTPIHPPWSPFPAL